MARLGSRSLQKQRTKRGERLSEIVSTPPREINPYRIHFACRAPSTMRPTPRFTGNRLATAPARPPDRSPALGPPSADLPVGENLRTRPLPHLPPSCGIGAASCCDSCCALNPITSTATAVRPPLDHEDQGDVSLPISTSIGTFPQDPERPDTEGCGCQPEAPGVMPRTSWESGIGTSGRPQKKFIKRRLGLQFVAAYPRLCSTAPLTPI